MLYNPALLTPTSGWYKTVHRGFFYFFFFPEYRPHIPVI